MLVGNRCGVRCGAGSSKTNGSRALLCPAVQLCHNNSVGMSCRCLSDGGMVLLVLSSAKGRGGGLQYSSRERGSRHWPPCEPRQLVRQSRERLLLLLVLLMMLLLLATLFLLQQCLYNSHGDTRYLHRTSNVLRTGPWIGACEYDSFVLSSKAQSWQSSRSG